MELAVSAGFFTAVSFACAVWGLSGSRFERDVIGRLGRYVSRPVESHRTRTVSAPFNRRIIQPILARLRALVHTRISETMRRKIRMKLLNAGYPLQISAEDYFVKKGALVAAAVLAVAAFQYDLGADVSLICVTAAVLALAFAGFLYFGVLMKIRKRTGIIERELPELLDIAQVGVEAGLSIDHCLERIVQEPSGQTMAYELKIYLQEVKMGVPRAEALHHLHGRTDSKPVKYFTDGIIQSLESGGTMANILEMIRRDVYEHIRGAAEKKANKAPVVMMIPLVLFIFPTVFIITLGPTLLMILDDFGKIGMGTGRGF
ncbi:type II secretion system F family protein [bacterium]|nr:type II secretion system F family protein [bacterium]